MNAQYEEEQAAWVHRTDRFDGFDRGDLDNQHADDYNDDREWEEAQRGVQ